MIISTFPAALRIRSKADARQFHSCIKHTFTIPYTDDMVIRVEPNNLIGIVSKESIREGYAWAIPNLQDDDGTTAYSLRKYINAWLEG